MVHASLLFISLHDVWRKAFSLSILQKLFWRSTCLQLLQNTYKNPTFYAYASQQPVAYELQISKRAFQLQDLTF